MCSGWGGKYVGGGRWWPPTHAQTPSKPKLEVDMRSSMGGLGKCKRKPTPGRRWERSEAGGR